MIVELMTDAKLSKARHDLGSKIMRTRSANVREEASKQYRLVTEEICERLNNGTWTLK